MERHNRRTAKGKNNGCYNGETQQENSKRKMMQKQNVTFMVCKAEKILL